MPKATSVQQEITENSQLKLYPKYRPKLPKMNPDNDGYGDDLRDQLLRECIDVTGERHSKFIWTCFIRVVPHYMMQLWIDDVRINPGRNPAAVLMSKVKKWNGGTFTGILPAGSD